MNVVEINCTDIGKEKHCCFMRNKEAKSGSVKPLNEEYISMFAQLKAIRVWSMSVLRVCDKNTMIIWRTRRVKMFRNWFISIFHIRIKRCSSKTPISFFASNIKTNWILCRIITLPFHMWKTYLWLSFLFGELNGIAFIRREMCWMKRKLPIRA